MAWNRGRKERHDGPKRDALIDVDMLMPHSWRWFAQLRWAEGERGLGFGSWEGSSTSIVHNFDYKKQITTLAAPPYLSDHSRIFIAINKIYLIRLVVLLVVSASGLRRRFPAHLEGVC